MKENIQMKTETVKESNNAVTEEIREIKNKSKGFVTDFKDFAFTGNVVDMTVGFVLGTGFTIVIKSLVENIIMPPIGYVLDKVNFDELYINLSGGNYSSMADAEEAGAVVIKYGLFLTELLSFLILAFIVFIVLRYVLRVKAQDKDTK